MARRDRRTRSHREVRRAVVDKHEKFLDLYERGFSRSVIGAKLGYSIEQVDWLFEVAQACERDAEREAVEGGGGGG